MSTKLFCFKHFCHGRFDAKITIQVNNFATFRPVLTYIVLTGWTERSGKTLCRRFLIVRTSFSNLSMSQ